VRMISVVAITLTAMFSVANARSRSDTSTSSRSYRSERSADTFRTSNCKSDSCFDKHPNGSWTHPITSKVSLLIAFLTRPLKGRAGGKAFGNAPLTCVIDRQLRAADTA